MDPVFSSSRKSDQLSKKDNHFCNFENALSTEQSEDDGFWVEYYAKEKNKNNHDESFIAPSDQRKDEKQILSANLQATQIHIPAQRTQVRPMTVQSALTLPFSPADNSMVKKRQLIVSHPTRDKNIIKSLTSLPASNTPTFIHHGGRQLASTLQSSLQKASNSSTTNIISSSSQTHFDYDNVREKSHDEHRQIIAQRSGSLVNLSSFPQTTSNQSPIRPTISIKPQDIQPLQQIMVIGNEFTQCSHKRKAQSNNNILQKRKTIIDNSLLQGKAPSLNSLIMRDLITSNQKSNSIVMRAISSHKGAAVQEEALEAKSVESVGKCIFRNAYIARNNLQSPIEFASGRFQNNNKLTTNDLQQLGRNKRMEDKVIEQSISRQHQLEQMMRSVSTLSTTSPHLMNNNDQTIMTTQIDDEMYPTRSMLPPQGLSDETDKVQFQGFIQKRGSTASDLKSKIRGLKDITRSCSNLSEENGGQSTLFERSKTLSRLDQSTSKKLPGDKASSNELKQQEKMVLNAFNYPINREMTSNFKQFAKLFASQNGSMLGALRNAAEQEKSQMRSTFLKESDIKLNSYISSQTQQQNQQIQQLNQNYHQANKVSNKYLVLYKICRKRPSAPSIINMTKQNLSNKQIFQSIDIPSFK